MLEDDVELLLNKTWRPTVSYVGADGFPTVSNAGNVLRPFTVLKLSIRVPPGINIEKAVNDLKHTLERDPPYGASVHFEAPHAGPGWESPQLAHWLEQEVHNVSKIYYKKECCFVGEGGSIPFMGMLGEKFPKAQFVITGVLGPQSNAHGPNEFLDIEFAKKLTCCVANIIATQNSHQDNK